MNNETSFVLPAARVRTLAHNGRVHLNAAKQKVIDKIISCDKDDKCVHRIPLLGLVYHSHPLWSGIDEMMESHPAIQAVLQQSAPIESFFDVIEAAAKELGDASMTLSLGDYHTLTAHERMP